MRHTWNIIKTRLGLNKLIMKRKKLKWAWKHWEHVEKQDKGRELSRGRPWMLLWGRRLGIGLSRVWCWAWVSGGRRAEEDEAALEEGGVFGVGQAGEPLERYAEVLDVGWAWEAQCIPAGVGWRGWGISSTSSLEPLRKRIRLMNEL